MGFLDTISKEDRVGVTYSDFYALMREAAKAELLLNGIKHRIDYADLYAIATGEKHPYYDCKVNEACSLLNNEVLVKEQEETDNGLE